MPDVGSEAIIGRTGRGAAIQKQQRWIIAYEQLDLSELGYFVNTKRLTAITTLGALTKVASVLIIIAT